MTAVERVVRAESLLEEAGVDGRVRAAGMDGEIAAVTAGRDALRRLETLAPELRDLGFRYVALDLTHESGNPIDA